MFVVFSVFFCNVCWVSSGYRDDSLETVKRNEQQYGIPLKVVSYEELYGWTMDRIVEQVRTASKCTKHKGVRLKR